MSVRTVLLLLPVILTSCLGTKYLKKDESVLKNQKINTSGEVSKDVLREQLTQSPNTRLAFFPIAHLFHIKKLGESFYDSARTAEKRTKIDNKYRSKINKAKSSKRKSKLNTKRVQKLEKKDKKLKEGNQLMRWGESLAVFDSSKISGSVNNLQNYLFAHGYFNATVETKIETDNKKTTIHYTIGEQKAYTIDSMIYVIADDKVKQLFMEHLDEQLLQDEQYDQDLFGNERNRVYDLMSNNGYFNFKRQYVLFEVDSTILNSHRLVVRETIVNPPDKSSHQPYRLDSVTFSADLAGVNRYLKPVEYNNVTYNFRGSRYSEKLISRRIFLREDSLYSKQLTFETQRQLSYLDIFKFVNVNYDTTGGKFIANIFTSPLKKYQTSTETGLSIFDAQGYPGPFFNLNVKGRNIFGGLEIVQLEGNVSIQGLQSVTADENVSTQNFNYSRLQYGGKLSFTFPQFLFPIGERQRNFIGKFNPRTKLSAGVNFEDRIGEYKRNTVNTSMSYIWQVGDQYQFTFTPFDASYIFSEKTDQFNQELENEGNQSIIAAFNPSFFVFSAVAARINKGNYGVGNSNSHFIQASLESGGNMLNAFNGLKAFDSLENYKYLKAAFEFRQNIRLTSRSSFAYKINVGAAYAYGANNGLPYEKYFFAGGSNSIRAWQPRRLGPGAYAPYDSAATDGEVKVDYLTERAGDILLETSAEFRSSLVGFIDYALFVDMGNMWLWESENVNPESDGDSNDNGKFRFDQFTNELAVGAGFGLRFDFSFLVLRLDLAYKVVDPAYPKGQRFLLNDYQFNDLWDFRNHATLNIGIGYPF